MKLLILAIYTEDEFYDKMMLQTNEYLHALTAFPKCHDTFAYYFIIYKFLVDKEYIIDHDKHILYINGTDSLMPGILYKTLDAMDILINKLNMKFDFIMRTTTATGIDIPKMVDTLNYANPEENHYIGNMVTLNWIDVPYGIVDTTCWGTKYCGGNFTIFNSKIGLDMVAHRDFFAPIDTIVDDVVIGYYIRRNVPDVEYINWNIMSDGSGEMQSNRLVSFHNSHKQDRIVDVNNHKRVVEHLIRELSKY